MRYTFNNYRSLKSVEIEIPPGVTAVVGPTDSGKSNLVRAITDLHFGAVGSDAVRHGEKSFEITWEGAPGCRVVYRKGTKLNRYEVAGASPEPLVFSGHGREVPKDVETVTGVFKVEVDADLDFSPSIADQHHPLFILASSPPVIAKILGSVSGLHIVLAAVRDASAAAAKASSEANREASAILALEAALATNRQTAATLNTAEQSVSRYVERAEVAVARHTRIEVIMEHLATYEMHRKAAQERSTPAIEAGKATEHFGNVVRGMSRAGNAKNAAVRVGASTKAIVEMKRAPGPKVLVSINKELDGVKALLTAAVRARQTRKAILDLTVEVANLSDHVPATLTLPDVPVVVARSERAVRLTGLIKTLMGSIEILNRGIEHSEREWEEAKTGLAEFSGCPLCGKPLSGDESHAD